VIVVDTTILVYAVGDDHPLREPSRRLLAAHRDGSIEAGTTVEVIQEFAHVRARRRDRHDAVDLARNYLRALTILVTTAEELERGLDLYERSPDLGAFDAVLAAVALEREAEALISGDHAYGVIDGLRWIGPAMPEFDRWLNER
jgi:predicted nucleic acid-binding protein